MLQQVRPQIPNVLGAAVHQLLRDADRRKRNVIITGLPEGTGSNDETLFLNLCETHLGSKPAVTNCLRIGKVTPGKPRRLLGKLRTDEAASQLMSDARKLRRVSNAAVSRTVFINPDLAPAVAKERQLKRLSSISSIEDNLFNLFKTISYCLEERQ
jgi:hypothetical protein